MEQRPLNSIIIYIMAGCSRFVCLQCAKTCSIECLGMRWVESVSDSTCTASEIASRINCLSVEKQLPLPPPYTHTQVVARVPAIFVVPPATQGCWPSAT